MSRRGGGGARNIKRRKEADVIEESGPGYAGLPDDVCGSGEKRGRPSSGVNAAERERATVNDSKSTE